LLLAVACALSAQAKLITKTVEYQQGGTTLEGYLAYDDSVSGSRPGVLVVHQWMGLTDYERHRAAMLAQLGYVAFCADVYGKGVRPKNPQEAGAEATKYKTDRALLRLRVNAGLAELKKCELVDAKRVAAIGYCFGGTTVLELARSGAELNGVVSFHGGLDSPTPADEKKSGARCSCATARMIRWRSRRISPRLKTKCVPPTWIGGSSNTAARCTPSRSRWRAMTIPRARPTTNARTGVRGRT